MNAYRYIARDSAGQTVEGSLKAATRFDALAVLHERGLTTVALQDGEAADLLAPPKAAGSRGFSPFRRGISLSERAVFCRQMAVSVGAGVTLRESLEAITEDIDHPAFRVVLKEVGAKLDDGRTFSQAMIGHEAVFSKLFVALIRAAEESGNMAQTLAYLADSMEKADRLAHKIRSITAYPIFVAVVFSVVAIAMTVFVLPHFQEAFESFNAQLPLLTKTVLAGNRFILRNALPIALGLALFAVLAAGYMRTTAGRVVFDRIALRTPFFGACVRKLAVARFCRNLGIMVNGGVPIATALAITSEVLGNRVLEAAMRTSRDRIIAGADISTSLDRRIFPGLMVRMIRIGESSGRLPEVLAKVSDMYEDQVESSVLIATSLFEPIVICVFGAFVLVLVMAIYLPVFTVASHVQ